MEIGIDSFVQMGGPELTGAQRAKNLMEEIKLADRVGISTYGIGEHHRVEYLASSPAIFLAAAASVTEQIRLSSAVTVLSSDDPVRVFQDFATIDLISNGRAEIVVGRGSFIESYPLFGYDTKHYDELFAEKLDLLLKLRDETLVTWQGKHRSSLNGQGVWPRPVQQQLPVRLGVGGTPASFARAGLLGLPLTVAIIGGEPHRFRPMIDLYRQAWARAGHDPAKTDVSVHALGFLADTDQQAADIFWPSHKETFGRIGRERGWGPITRESFDAQLAPTAAYLIGAPETVATKLRYYDEVLGGLSQVALHMSGGGVAHADQMRSIELLGTLVGPIAG
ncbi:LLM class flavin-dependent oxidoreductase [Terriglobus saanensis]|uniref:Luciferase-like, subgroup n=1 Tax=Terriglobus saanensis (strain ATCC BAA-1853 / DSM 23119 / SP1PR4) TaxID=401053 RepID=E8V0M5_TERSS|nr:LLM class flavin-dependent oxidoreductase [Terriglobus saanensis]ADV81088.1 Luciferase-like, subgroup [Terriglobus saanensis SP1PR4]